jgi:gamma-glutamyl:cysteine ligase YbdK (ATP-grasp superfamily)
MKRLFDPLTMGYDWEMAVVKETMESAGEEEIVKLSDQIRNSLPWSRVGIDIDLLEARLGVVKNWSELVERTFTYMRETKRLAAKKKYIVLPIGARPIEQMPIGSHIHVGTCTDVAGATALKNSFGRFVPVFIAISANSPVYRLESGEYKNYRISTNAEWCSAPNQICHPRYYRDGWGEDITVKVWGNNTIELRCCDSTSDAKLMCELTLLTAALMHGLSGGIETEACQYDADDYYWTAINRWRATKYGLQAKLMWDGQEKPVSEIARSMIDIASDGISILGAKKSDLVTINKMLEKRQTQSDFVIALQKDDADPHRLFRALATIYDRDQNAFAKYLDMASTLPVLEPMDIEEFVFSKLTKEVPLFEAAIRTPLSPYDFDRLVDKLEAEGRIKVAKDETWGRTLTKL